MTRYTRMFDSLRSASRGALVPFAVIGDPTPARSERWLRRLLDTGVDALELGIPFSDPVADGPVVQQAAQRALAAGTTPAIALEIVAGLRALDPQRPLGLLVYANLVCRRGLDRFYREVADAGADSVLVPDLPVEEAAPFRIAAQRAGICSVSILPPNASSDHASAIVSASRGYIYLTARRGVTGEGPGLAADLERRIDLVRSLGGPPTLVGFGIGSPADAGAALAAGADGAIVGSALIDRATRDPDDAIALLERIKPALARPSGLGPMPEPVERAPRSTPGTLRR